MSVTSKIPKGLHDAMMGDRLVLFVGAGLSRSAGAPDWRGLLNSLIGLCKKELVPIADESELHNLVNGPSADMLIAAGYLQDQLKERMDQHIYDTLQGLSIQDVHRTIVQLPIAGIVTTNFDTLLESAYREVLGISPTIVLPRDVHTLARIDERKPWVLKLHGTSDAPSNIVLSTRDFEDLMNNAAAMTTLTRLLQQYTFLFLGFSLNDPDTLDLLSRLRISFSGRQRRHYALMESTAIGPIKLASVELQYQIQILKYTKSSDAHPEVLDFVRLLAAQYAQAREATMQKLLFLITRPGVWPSSNSEPLLLVTNANPQWRSSGSSPALSSVESRAYLLPSLTGNASDLDSLGISLSNLLGVAPAAIILHPDTETFVSSKFNPALGKPTRYTFTFVSVELANQPANLAAPQLSLGGRWYEWQSVLSLRGHTASMALNGDVFIELCRRYGSRLERLPISMNSPLHISVDPYDYRARTYDRLSWVRDDSLHARIVAVAETMQARGIVDLGCGPALLGQMYSYRKDFEYVGLEGSVEMLARAKENLSGKPYCCVKGFDISQDSMVDKYDQWCFVLKNVLHLASAPFHLITSLKGRLGRPAALLIIETVSPNMECLSWIQLLFEALGVHHKKNWFLRGQLEYQLKLLGVHIRSIETYDQFIEIDPWLSSFPLSVDQRHAVRDIISSMPPSVRNEMKYALDNSTGQEHLLRLQEILVVDLDGGDHRV